MPRRMDNITPSMPDKRAIAAIDRSPQCGIPTEECSEETKHRRYWVSGRSFSEGFRTSLLTSAAELATSPHHRCGECLPMGPAAWITRSIWKPNDYTEHHSPSIWNPLLWAWLALVIGPPSRSRSLVALVAVVAGAQFSDIPDPYQSAQK
jgi:hypothetical protein